MKCKHWERRNRGPVRLVTANATQGSITAERIDELQAEVCKFYANALLAGLLARKHRDAGARRLG